MNAKNLAILSVAYTGFAFIFSLTSFFAYEPAQSITEYSGAGFLIPEIVGHILFASVATIPFLDLGLIALSSVIAILIDTDHIFNVLGFSILGRADHSFLFIAASTMLLVYVAQRMNLPKSSLIKIIFIVPVAILTHLSYDIFAAYVVFRGPGFSFPFLYPFSSEFFSFQFQGFIIFEVAAVALAVLGSLLSHRESTRKLKKK